MRHLCKSTSYIYQNCFLSYVWFSKYLHDMHITLHRRIPTGWAKKVSLLIFAKTVNKKR